MTIHEYFGDWAKVIDLSETEKIVKKLSCSNQLVCPQIKDIFKAFTLCPLRDLKVVIIGQDPYSNLRNGKPVATGIAFANKPSTPISSYSPSLEILKESVIDYTRPHGNINFDPSLEKWEKQGVLLLNSALSCFVGKTGSNSLLWRPFIKALLTNLSMFDTGIIYVLMGNDAQSFEPYIKAKFNHIIKTKHPSWYARNKTRMPSDLWHQINSILKKYQDCQIQWYEES